MYNFIPLLRPYPTPGDHDLNKLESTLPEDASILINFPSVMVFEKKILKIFSIYSYVKLHPSIVTLLYPREPRFEQT